MGLKITVKKRKVIFFFILKAHVHLRCIARRAEFRTVENSENYQPTPNSESNPHSSSSFPGISLFFCVIKLCIISSLFISVGTFKNNLREERKIVGHFDLSTCNISRWQCSCTVVIPKEYILLRDSSQSAFILKRRSGRICFFHVYICCIDVPDFYRCLTLTHKFY